MRDWCSNLVTELAMEVAMEVELAGLRSIYSHAGVWECYAVQTLGWGWAKHAQGVLPLSLA